MSKSLQDYTKKELLALPFNHDSNIAYSSLMVVPERRKHESGWGVMAIIGLVEETPTAIVGHCDDLCIYDKYDNQVMPNSVRFDMTYPHGVMHMWSRRCDFSVSGYSSANIIYRKKDATL